MLRIGLIGLDGIGWYGVAVNETLAPKPKKSTLLIAVDGQQLTSICGEV